LIIGHRRFQLAPGLTVPIDASHVDLNIRSSNRPALAGAGGH
jgi:hypothetical protein